MEILLKKQLNMLFLKEQKRGITSEKQKRNISDITEGRGRG
jgi:hypothetical protein